MLIYVAEAVYTSVTVNTKGVFGQLGVGRHPRAEFSLDVSISFLNFLE